MNEEVKVTEFKKWAASMGCPTENIPPDEVLKRMFRNKESAILDNMMKRLKPKEEVARIKKAILLSKMKKQAGKLLPELSKNSHPAEYARYLKVEKLKSRINETETRMNNDSTKIKLLREKTKKNNLEKMQTLEKIESVDTKIAVFQAKSYQLDAFISEEEIFQESVRKAIPVKPSNSCNYEDASMAVAKGLDVLKFFYDVHKDDMEKQSVRTELWVKLRSVLGQIPNHLLFEVVEKINSERLEKIIGLANILPQEKQNQLELEIYKMYAHHINKVVDYTALCQQYQDKSDKFIDLHMGITEIALDKFNMTVDNVNEDLIQKYIALHVKNICNDAKMEFISNEIDKYKKIIESNKLRLYNHNDLVREIKNIHAKSEEIISDIQRDVCSIEGIETKISYSKNTMIYLIQAKRSRKTNNCTEAISLPSYLNEINQFDEIPLKHFKIQNNINDLSGTSVICLDANIDNLLQIPGHLLTLEGSLLEIENFLEMEPKWKQLTRDLIIHGKLDNVDEKKLKKRVETDFEYMSELLHQIKLGSVKIGCTLDEAIKYYNFLLSNPLKKFIPDTKLFNGRTYAEYEAQYLVYFRMLNGCHGHK